MLARCSAKEELLERRRARLEITDYANLSIGDIVSGYIGQVHNSRDLEIDMVKQIQQKSEVHSLACSIVILTMLAPSLLLMIEYVVDLASGLPS